MRWREWLVGWVIAVVLAGGVAYVVTAEGSPVRPFGDPVVTETTIREVVVLPVGQAEVSGTVVRLRATGATGPSVAPPIVVPTGTALIEGALVGGARSTIVWDGGRPFHLESDGGGLDLGPTTVELDDRSLAWPLDDGVRVLLPGDYLLDTPVAVGAGGIAGARDAVAFAADDDTTIETTGWTITRARPAMLHLEGPGGLVLEGDLVVRTRDGSRRATRLALADGPYVVDLDGDRVTATVRGEMDVE